MTLLLIYTIIWTAWFVRHKTPFFRVDFFFTAMTMIMALSNFNPFIEYRQSISLEVLFLVITVHLGFCVSFSLARMKRPFERIEFSEQHGRLLYLALFVISLVFSILLIVESLMRGAIPILSNFSAAQVLREAHWRNVGSISFLDRIENLFSYFTMMFVIGFPFARKHLNASFFVFLIAVLALVEHSLSKGARATIVFTLIGISATYFSIYKFDVKKFGLLLVTAILAFVLLGGYFYISRNQNFTAAPDLFLSYSCAGAIYSDLADVLPPVGKAAVLSSCYFSSPPQKFQIFMDNWNSNSYFALGGYNFSIFSGDTFSDVRADIFDLFRSEGFGGNPWSTFARDAYIDFGWAAPLFAALLGAMLGWFAPLRAGSSYMATVRFGILACFAFFMPFMSPLVIRPIIYSMLFLAVFPTLIGLMLQQRPPSFRKADRARVR